MKIRTLGILGLMIWAAPVDAATLYRDTVACTGNYSVANRNCTGSDGSSYTSNANAIAAMVAGDTILVRAGTYDDRVSFVNRTGSSGARRTFKAYPGEAVVFRSTTTSSYGLLISSSTYITIQDLTIDGINSTSSLSNRIEGSTTTEIVFEGVTFKNWIDGNGIYVTAASNVIFRRSNFLDNGDYTTCTTGQLQYGIYVHDGTNITVEKSVISGNANGGVHLFPGPLTGVSFLNNVVTNNSRCSASAIGGLIVAADSTGGNISGVKIHGNLIYGNPSVGTLGNGGGVRAYASGGRTVTGIELLRNTIYNNQANAGTAYGINIQSGPSGTIIGNNHIVANESGQILDAGTGTVQFGNRTTGAITDCTVSTTDFAQKAGSLCIDAGVSDGLPSNGLPDIGAFQTFTFASCQVPNGAAGTIQITFTSNVNLLGSTLTTFTARRNGSNNALTGAATKIGDTIVSIPVTTTYVGGDTVDWSWASGGFTDNAQIGGTLNQPFLPVTNQSCTNNAGGAPTHVLTQKMFQYRGVYGPENTTDIRGAENRSTYTAIRSGGTRLRIAVQDSVSNAPAVAFFLHYAKDGGSYSQLTDTFGSDHVAFCGDRYSNMGVENRTTTTNQLSLSGTFVPGAVILTSNAIPTVTGLNVGYKVESEYCVAWDALASGVYTFRLYNQDGTAIAYDAGATPSVTVGPLQANFGQ